MPWRGLGILDIMSRIEFTVCSALDICFPSQDRGELVHGLSACVGMGLLPASAAPQAAWVEGAQALRASSYQDLLARPLPSPTPVYTHLRLGFSW